MHIDMDTGDGQLQHLHVDAVLLHLREPELGQVDEPPRPAVNRFGLERAAPSGAPLVHSLSSQKAASNAISLMFTATRP
jgi:hypothetical protein